MTDKVIEVDLEQGTDAWHAFRRRHMMASTAAIVMGCAPSYWQINTPSLLRQYNEGGDFPPSDFAKRLFRDAHEAERRAREAMSGFRLEDEHDDEPRLYNYEPKVFVRGRYAASLDGYETLKGKTWLEVKMVNSPESASWKAAMAGRVLPHHYWQLVHQAYCVPDETEGVHFVVTTRTDQRRHIYREKAKLMDDWPNLKAAWESIDDEKEAAAPADATAAAEKYARLSRRHDEVKAELDAAKKALLEHGPCEYPGVLKVTKFTARGRIDYRAAAEAHYGEDAEALEVYRGMPYEGHRITLAKGEKESE